MSFIKEKCGKKMNNCGVKRLRVSAMNSERKIKGKKIRRETWNKEIGRRFNRYRIAAYLLANIRVIYVCITENFRLYIYECVHVKTSHISDI